MTEVLFYHLTEQRTEQALPGLLERTLERGWRAVVQTVDETRCAALDAHLWTWRDDSFLPHAAQGDEKAVAADQPIWLTTTTENPNGSQVRFLIDGAVPPVLADYERAIFMFDGHDMEAVNAARERWKIEKDNGHDLTYWQQDGGRWEKKA